MLFDLQKFSDNIALCTEQGDISYRDCFEKAEELAGVIGKRCLAFLFCSNTAESIIGYVGMINHRIVPVMLDSELDAAYADNLLQIYLPAYLWLPAEKAARYKGYRKILAMDRYVLLEAVEHHDYSLHGDLALLMTTSGSTGSPKFVRISYRNLQANTDSIIEYLKIDEHERAVTNLPMHYVYGLSVINTHLAAGASLAVTKNSMFQGEFWEIIKQRRVTSLAGVPYTYEMLKKLRFLRMELPALKTMTQAGGKLSKELHQEFAEYAEKTGKKFVVMYGAAEATARMGYLPPVNTLKKIGAMGIAIPGGRFELWTDNREIIEECDVAGELIYYGDNVTMGYADSLADLNSPDENKGRYLTGDIAKRDADGYYTVVGRKKNFLKIFGKRVNLLEAENILKLQYKTAEIACAGYDDHMYIFSECEMDERDLIRYASAKLGLPAIAFTWQKVDKIPRNATGKVLYKELAVYYLH